MVPRVAAARTTALLYWLGINRDLRKNVAVGKGENIVGSGPTSRRGLTAADTLLFVAVCEGMLADEEWLAKQPESWRAALIDLRDGLLDELAGHPLGTPSEE